MGECTNLPIDISINDLVVNEADSVASFTVSLSGPSTSVVTVDYVTQSGSATGGVDYIEVASPLTLLFSPGETSKSVDITILQDALAEGSQTFTVVLSGATNATLINASGLATIVDEEVDPCGRPTFNAAVDQGVYLWRDCGTDVWHMAATAGGAPTQVIYQGDISSNMAILDLTPNSIEINDILDANPAPHIVDFELRMKTTGYDGFDFALSVGASACFTVSTASPGDGSVTVGAVQTTLTTPLSLSTLGACQ